MPESKITDEMGEKIASMYLDGAKIATLVAEFCVSQDVIREFLNKREISRPPTPRGSKSRDMKDFASRCKSILWRQNQGADKKVYNEWCSRVAALESEDGGAYTHDQAIVRASKEYTVLHKLFREYDVKDFDPNPESHADIKYFGAAGMAAIEASGKVVCEGLEMSYRDSLRWAINAAGMHLRTGQQPLLVPCDMAWYLYCQAISEPKDFMSKVGQIESKGDAEAGEKSQLSKSSRRSIKEIDDMLAEIDAIVGENNASS